MLLHLAQSTAWSVEVSRGQTKGCWSHHIVTLTYFTEVGISLLACGLLRGDQ